MIATAGGELTAEEGRFTARRGSVYHKRLALGVAREQARKDLPLSTYTEAYWKIDLHNLLHFLELRMDGHAQWEIRQYAETIGREIVRPLLPLVWEAFVDYRLTAMALSRLEQEVTAAAGRRGRAAGRGSRLPGRRRPELGRPGALPRTRRVPGEARAAGDRCRGRRNKRRNRRLTRMNADL